MRARRTDGNHKPTLDALRALGYPCKSLHTQGGGCEDILVGIPGGKLQGPRWVLLEMKVPTSKRGTVKPSAFTPAQVAWYERTKGYPRIIATSAEDAATQLLGLA